MLFQARRYPKAIKMCQCLEREDDFAGNKHTCDCSGVDWKKVSETLKRVGTIIIRNLLARLDHCNVILYASPGKEEFYKTFGMRKMKTGMALLLSRGK